MNNQNINLSKLNVTVDTIVKGLENIGYKDRGGSDVWRMLVRSDGQVIKVYYDNYENPTTIIIRESQCAYEKEE